MSSGEEASARGALGQWLRSLEAGLLRMRHMSPQQDRLNHREMEPKFGGADVQTSRYTAGALCRCYGTRAVQEVRKECYSAYQNSQITSLLRINLGGSGAPVSELTGASG